MNVSRLQPRLLKFRSNRSSVDRKGELAGASPIIKLMS
jgi:hypothetical protein